MSTLWQAENSDRNRIITDICSLLDSASATDWLGEPEAPVILKPNLVVGKSADSGATTHPEIVGGIIEYLADHGYRNLTVAEGSWVGDSTSRAFRKCGYTSLAKRYRIKLVDLQEDTFKTVRTDGDEFKICTTIASLSENGGSLVNIPVLKGHGQTRLTCALKNLKGCIPDSEKRRYHSLGVHRPVARLNTIIKPAFTLVDGLNGDPYWEEGGSPERRDILLLGRDPVAIDSYACSLLGISEKDVAYIALAASLGVGTSRTSASDVVFIGRAGPASATKSESAIKNKKLAGWIETITEQRAACSACFGNLAGALRDLHEKNPGIETGFGASSICIGQGFRGEELPTGTAGIGVCARGKRSITGCPPSRAAIADFLAEISHN